MKITVSDKVRIGDGVYCLADRVVQGLKEERIERGIWYVIAAVSDSQETLFILSNAELGNGLYENSNLHVVALAGSQSESFAVITEMVQEACDLDRLSDLKQYFLEY